MKSVDAITAAAVGMLLVDANALAVADEPSAEVRADSAPARADLNQERAELRSARQEQDSARRVSANITDRGEARRELAAQLKHDRDELRRAAEVPGRAAVAANGQAHLDARELHLDAHDLRQELREARQEAREARQEARQLAHDLRAKIAEIR